MADVIVGRFALIDLIAKGGSGSVWRAWDQKTQELCAAKVLRQRDSADLMRFVREKGVSFDHPHLLTPYGWGAEDEHVVIAMPLVSGGTLESVVKKKGKLAEPAVVVVLEQLLDGLAHIHEEGWIHRDVKPANIMFEPRGKAWPHSRLADFGIAVHETDVRFTHVGMVNGTPGYMAPELFAMAEPTPSHDLYAAGVVALVALNGPIKLHDGAFRPDELNQHLRGVTPKLSAVIRKLVAAQPEERYQDAQSVRRDLPRVPRGYPLTLADGTPLEFSDTLDPLPPNAPGARRPERPAPGVASSSMEAIRSGRVQQGFSAASASPQTGPQWAGGPGQPGSPRGGGPQQGGQPYRQGGPQGGPSRGGYQQGGPQQGRTGMQGPQHGGSRAATGSRTGSGTGGRSTTTSQGITGTITSTLTGTGPNAGRNRSTLVAAAIGAVAALVLGVIVAVVLVNVFDGSSASGPTSTIDSSYALVEAGQECVAEDLGVIGMTEDGRYLSCSVNGEGHAFG
ncbi:serine/threonine protein kinase [Brachybacterium muris]|uniref:serine/threonine protein kinase n=1 Tax=Brachybacterium muris TaxID=219301 RepID=UPI00223B6793|nr:serine/threonine-protein kinase [Brachybacterium muris]MCT2177179.1 serine/threonine protein kinase [Brachybacterium muris]